jgi:methionyl-tRNA formyltransferase
MRVVFIGGTKRGYLTLKALIDTHANVIGIVSLLQDEHEIDRYEQPIQNLATELGIPHYETKWMKDRNYQESIAALHPDIIFIVGCRILIPPEIYQIPPLGSLAVHDSLLPNYRGFAPLNWSILNGETQTGVTLFHLNESMDGGDIVVQKCVSIDPDDEAPSVYDRVCDATIDIVLEAYTLFCEGSAIRIEQDYATGSFTCSRTPEDGMIDWHQSTKTIYDRVRALAYPYPGAFTIYETKRLTIWKAKPVTDPPNFVGRIPGRVVQVSRPEGYIDVLTGDGILRIFEVQLAGAQRTASANVIKSVKSTLGLRMTDLLDRIQILEQTIIKLQHEK